MQTCHSVLEVWVEGVRLTSISLPTKQKKKAFFPLTLCSCRTISSTMGRKKSGADGDASAEPRRKSQRLSEKETPQKPQPEKTKAAPKAKKVKEVKKAKEEKKEEPKTDDQEALAENGEAKSEEAAAEEDKKEDDADKDEKAAE